MRFLLAILLTWSGLAGAQPFTLLDPNLPFDVPASSSIPAPDIWLKPEGITTNGNNTVLQWWPDSSGNYHNFGLNSSGLTWSNNQVNGFGSGFANGTSYMLGTNSQPLTANIEGASAFCVVKIGAFGSPVCELVTFTAGTVNERFSLEEASSGTLRWSGRTLDADTVYSTASKTFPGGAVYFLAEAVVSYTNATINVYTNGVLMTGDTNHITKAKTSNTSSSTTPRWAALGLFAPGQGMGTELIFYARTVTDSERINSIEPYFRSKYNLW